MKWGYLIPRMLVVLCLWAFVQFGFDPTLRVASEFGLATASQRPVKFGSVKTQFWPPRFEAETLEVAENDRLDQAELTAGKITVAMDEESLRNRRWIANEVTFEDVEWNVPAEFDAADIDEATGDSTWADGLRDKGRAALDHQLAEMKQRFEERLDPNTLETVRLAKVKRVAYEQEIASLKQQILDLRQKADTIKSLAQDPGVRRAILLEPGRIETMARDAATTKDKIRLVRDKIALLKEQAPVDFAELKAAKDRDVAQLKSDLTDMKSDPMEVVELLLGGPVADTLDKIAVWWPRWQKFQHSGQWKEQYQHAERGRTVVFLPEQAGPTAGIRHLLITGRANDHGQATPFRCELNALTYPPQQDVPASFQWLSDGGATIQASGLVRLHNDQPEMTIQFRMQQKTAVTSNRQVGKEAAVAFASGPTVVQGTVSLGDVIHGDCQLLFPNANANIRTGDERYDALLSALDVNAANLTPTLSFNVSDDARDYNLACEGLSSATDAWSQQLSSIAQQQTAKLQLQAETYLNEQLSEVNLHGLELNQLLAALPNVQLPQVAGRPLLPESIRQTAGERVQKKAASLFDRILK